MSTTTISVELTERDIESLKLLSQAVNKTAYHGGLGLQESGRFLAVIHKILTIANVDLLDIPHSNRGPDAGIAEVFDRLNGGTRGGAR